VYGGRDYAAKSHARCHKIKIKKILQQLWDWSPRFKEAQAGVKDGYSPHPKKWLFYRNYLQ